MSVEQLALLSLLAGAGLASDPAARLRNVLAKPARSAGPLESARRSGRVRSGRRAGWATATSPSWSPLHGSARWRRGSTSAAVDVPVALALELRSGRELGPALEAVSLEQQGFPELSARLHHAAAVAMSGGDVGAALLGSSPAERDPVAAALLVTAACCGSSVSSGLPLADLLDAAGSAARAGLSLQGMARAELAGARSTTVVLAALPLAGIAMGQSLGARPAAVLFGTGWGAGCLLGAICLTTVGVLWTRAITRGLRQALP